MDSAKLEELERLYKAATPGPWTAGRHDMKSIVEGYPAKYIYSPFQAVAIACGEDVAWYQVICNAEYIAAACNAVPELIAENRALRERAQMRQELVEQYEKDIARLRQKVRELEIHKRTLACRLSKSVLHPVLEERSIDEWIKRAEEAAKEAGE